MHLQQKFSALSAQQRPMIGTFVSLLQYRKDLFSAFSEGFQGKVKKKKSRKILFEIALKVISWHVMIIKYYTGR